MSATSSTRGGSRSRLRARALWAFILAGIGFVAIGIGLVQYALSGTVSIRPGQEPVGGMRAIEELAAIAFVSAAFLGYGLVLRHRTR